MIDNTLKELTKDRIAIWIFRSFLFLLIVAFIYFSFRTFQKDRNGDPVNYLWGFYKTNKIDTLIVIKYDTVVKYVPNNSKQSFQPNKNYHDETKVTSNDQKGGQTAKEIINNK